MVTEERPALCGHVAKRRSSKIVNAAVIWNNTWRFLFVIEAVIATSKKRAFSDEKVHLRLTIDKTVSSLYLTKLTNALLDTKKSSYC